MLRRSWPLLKRELRVALQTFLVAWLSFTVALQLYTLYDSPKLHGAGDVLLLLTFGFFICAFYTFWPACVVTACRVVYRVLGWGAYVGAFLGALGIVVVAVASRHVLGGLIVEVFTSAGPMGPCGAHAVGPLACASDTPDHDASAPEAAEKFLHTDSTNYNHNSGVFRHRLKRHTPH